MSIGAFNQKFTIPAGDPNYRVDSEIELAHDVRMTAMLPHMHLRGKSFEYRIVRPDVQTETVLSVPHYNFNWQLTYYLEKPIHLTKGTKLEVTGWYDNSANNPFNPDPTKEVHWGEQTWEEMMMGYLNVAVDASQLPGPAGRARQLSGPVQ